MAQIDVSELLHDPDFVDNIQLINRVPQVNSRGEASFIETGINSVGSVQPASGKTIQRLPEEFRVANVSSFWYQGEIQAGGDGKYSSILVFRGKRYQVITVLDWTNFGNGWCEGVCVAEKPS